MRPVTAGVKVGVIDFDVTFSHICLVTPTVNMIDNAL